MQLLVTRRGRRGTLEVFNQLFPLRVPLRTLRLNPLLGYALYPMPGDLPGHGSDDSFCKTALSLRVVNGFCLRSGHQPTISRTHISSSTFSTSSNTISSPFFNLPMPRVYFASTSNLFTIVRHRIDIALASASPHTPSQLPCRSEHPATRQ